MAHTQAPCHALHQRLTKPRFRQRPDGARGRAGYATRLTATANRPPPPGGVSRETNNNSDIIRRRTPYDERGGVSSVVWRRGTRLGCFASQSTLTQMRTVAEIYADKAVPLLT